MGAAAAGTGTWRKGEFVRWTDLFIFIEASLVWLGLLVIAIAAVAGVATATHVPHESVSGALRDLPKSAVFVQGMAISYYLVLLYFLWRIARRVAATALVARYRAMPLYQFLLVVAGGIAVGFLVLYLNAYLIVHGLVDLHATRTEHLIAPRTLAELPLAFVVLALVAPFAEELYFRGIILGWLVGKMPVALAVVANAVLFGLVHLGFVAHHGPGGWYITGVLTLVGLAGAILAIRTRSLWASFGLHAAYNATLISAPLLLVHLS